MKRTMDPAFLISVANHPDVRPSLGGAGPLDQSLTNLISDPNNVTLECEYGGFVVQKLEHGVYECHSMFLPEGRGAPTLAAMQECLTYLFTRTDCIEAVTKVPEGNKGALGAGRILGFSTTYRLDRGWPMEDGTFSAVDCMSLHIMKWMQKDAHVQAKGEWFHQRLEDTTEGRLPVHYEEVSHNKAVGAAVLMFEAGNNLKAINTYNLWARRSGFATIKAISLNPLIIDMDQVIVEISNGDMEVLKCRLD